MQETKSWIARSLLFVGLVIVVDQVTKIIVLKTMTKGQSVILLGDWLKFTFTENPGMAFGLEFGPPALITIFSLVATLLIVVYLYEVGGVYRPYRISLCMVLGGALGNIIDRVLYGKLLYGDPYFLGKVVDFIHINIWRGYVPESIPIFGGRYLALFPIWNVADMAIVLGVIGIIVFQKHFHKVSLSGLGDSDSATDKSSEASETSSPETSSDPDLPGETGGEGNDSRE